MFKRFIYRLIESNGTLADYVINNLVRDYPYGILQAIAQAPDGFDIISNTTLPSSNINKSVLINCNIHMDGDGSVTNNDLYRSEIVVYSSEGEETMKIGERS